MQSERPATVIDPVCGMRVDVATAEQGGPPGRDGRTWGFAAQVPGLRGRSGPLCRSPPKRPPRRRRRTRSSLVVDEGCACWYERLLVLPRRRLPGDQGAARRRTRRRT
jgi:hypothetical protein